MTSQPSRLATLLPALPELIEAAQISPVFDNLYRLKCDQLKLGLHRLGTLLSRHNFYDCETVLELESDTGSERFQHQLYPGELAGAAGPGSGVSGAAEVFELRHALQGRVDLPRFRE